MKLRDPPAVEGEKLLIFADRSGLSDALVSAAAGQPVRAYAGDSFARFDEVNFQIRPDHPEDFQALLEALGPCPQIIYLWAVDAPPSSELNVDSLTEAQTLSAVGPLHLVQALAAQKGSRLWLVTRGAQPVATGDLPQLAQAPLWGLGRTLSVEHSALWGGLLDLDPAARPQDSAARILQMMAQAGQEDQVAFRQDRAYAARLRRVRPDAGVEVPLDADASYVVAGGLGGLGLVSARWLADRGARHLLLIGRTPLPPRSAWAQLEAPPALVERVRAVQALEARGISVEVLSADIADPQQMARLQDDHTIRGVIHAAGLLQYQSILEQDAASMRTILRAKVTGSWLLHELLRDAPLDFMIFFSSTSALLSSPMMGSYAAGNVFMDTLAHYRRAMGLPALSINWGTWREVGMALSFVEEHDRRAVTLAGTISNAEGLAALDHLVQQTHAQVAVLPVDWAAWQRLYPDFVKAPLLAQVIDQNAPDSGYGQAQPELDVWLGLPPDEREAALLPYLTAQVARILHASVDDVEPDQSILRMGVDSLMAIELKNRLERDLQVALAVVQLLQGPSVRQLAGMLAMQIEAGPLEEAEAVEDQWEEGEL